jgi:multidrug resistance efflux pump
MTYLKLSRVNITNIVFLLEFFLWYLFNYFKYSSKTSDGKIRADIIPLSTDVSCRIKHIYVHDKKKVK